MTLADGAIMFVACVLSFALGYAIGAFRVTRFVNKELHEINLAQEPYRKRLEQLYAKLIEENDKEQGDK
jgi:hypothetical protein